MNKTKFEQIEIQLAELVMTAQDIADGDLTGPEAAQEVLQRVRMIRENLPERGWKNPAAAENGKKGGRPKKAAGLALLLLFAAPLAPLPRTAQPDPRPSDPFVRETRRDAYAPGVGMDQYGRPTERRNREGAADPFTPTRPDALGPGIGTDATGRPTTVKPKK